MDISRSLNDSTNRFYHRKEFVDAYVDYVLNKSVEKVFEEFKRGFYKVCEKNLVRMFHPEELRGVMLGTEEYDWNVLKQVPAVDLFIYITCYKMDMTRHKCVFYD